MHSASVSSSAHAGATSPSGSTAHRAGLLEPVHRGHDLGLRQRQLLDQLLGLDGMADRVQDARHAVEDVAVDLARGEENRRRPTSSTR